MRALIIAGNLLHRLNSTQVDLLGVMLCWAFLAILLKVIRPSVKERIDAAVNAYVEEVKIQAQTELNLRSEEFKKRSQAQLRERIDDLNARWEAKVEAVRAQSQEELKRQIEHLKRQPEAERLAAETERRRQREARRDARLKRIKQRLQERQETETRRRQRIEEFEIQLEVQPGLTQEEFVKDHAAAHMQTLLDDAKEIRDEFAKFKTDDRAFANELEIERPELYAVAIFKVRALAEAERLEVKRLGRTSSQSGRDLLQIEDQIERERALETLLAEQGVTDLNQQDNYRKEFRLMRNEGKENGTRQRKVL